MGWYKLVSFSSVEGHVGGSCHHCNGLRIPEDGGGMFLRNVGKHLHSDTASHPKTPGSHGSEPLGTMKCGFSSLA